MRISVNTNWKVGDMIKFWYPKGPLECDGVQKDVEGIIESISIDTSYHFIPGRKRPYRIQSVEYMVIDVERAMSIRISDRYEYDKDQIADFEKIDEFTVKVDERLYAKD